MAKRYIICKLIFFDDTNIEFECNPFNLDRGKIKGKIGGDELTRLTIAQLNHWVSVYESYCFKNDLVVLGRHLYVLAFGYKEIREAFESAYRHLKEDKNPDNSPVYDGLKLYLVFHAEVDIMKTLPWEFLYLPLGRNDGLFLAGQETELILTRFVPEKRLDFQIDEGKENLRILVVHSQPAELDTVSAEKLIDKLKTLPHTDLRLLPDPERQNLRPTRKNLEDEINNYDPHIMHFIGHGMEGRLALIKEERFIREAQLENERLKALGRQPGKVQEADWVDSTVVRGFFDQKRPRVVFLHACKGESTVYLEESIQSFTSMARDLAYNTHIPAVIAMQYEIENEVAETFARRFYQEIRGGCDIDEAVTLARNELGKTPFQPDRQAWDDRSFGTPVIYLQNEQRIIQAPPADTGKQDQKDAGQDVVVATIRKEACPYTQDCNGVVVFGKNFCNTCHRKIIVCPNCGDRMIAKDIPFCDNCGYDGTKAAGTVDSTGVVSASVSAVQH